MKKLLVLATVLVIGQCARPFTNKYDNVNVDQVLQNSRLLDNYLKCLLDLGRCTPEGQELKTVVPDAIRNGCAQCNDKQKASSEKVIRHLVQQRPKDWDKLLKKYDPKGEYRVKYQHLLH